jgi:hypothetical protein
LFRAVATVFVFSTSKDGGRDDDAAIEDKLLVVGVRLHKPPIEAEVSMY